MTQSRKAIIGIGVAALLGFVAVGAAFCAGTLHVPKSANKTPANAMEVSVDARELASANPRNPLWLVPNSGHMGASVVAPDEFRERVLGWFAQH